ncbi:MAG: GIY-YIG nuclease family protein [Butyrivibrio sp.]|nr:GIY-YIG nuclease family protein [Butyrivibrio sp.]
MTRGKSINMFLMDGDVNGRIKCTLANWTGLAFKIPRTALDLCKDRDELKQTGVYLLFGKDDQTDKSVVYIGQAGVRKNGEGILNRLFEHNRNPEKDYWTEAIAITTSNDSLGPTEISYLEHRFCVLAKEANRYEVKNGNDPTPGNPSEEKISELEDFIDNAKIIVGTLGHKVFVPLVAGRTDDLGFAGKEPELYCTRSGVDARGVRTSDGFVVKEGSRVSEGFKPSCPEHIIKWRKKHSDKIDENNVLLEDILFNSPSGAAAFVCGVGLNGNVEWKTADGVTLKELDANEE